MPAATTSLANSLLNAVLRNTAYTSPATVYLAVFTSAPTAAGGGTEVIGGSYVRQAITFAAPSGGAATNAAQISIAGMPACTVYGLAIMGAASSGTMLFYGALATPKPVNAGDTFKVNAGDLNIALI